MSSDIFELLTKCATNERLDELVFHSSWYRYSQAEIDEAAGKLKEQGLTEDQNDMIDRLSCAYLSQENSYARAAYQQGFRDCVSLLHEIGLIG